jgi:hypothetical protein
MATKLTDAHPRALPVGTPVRVLRDNGAVLFTVTRALPWRVGGRWIVLVRGSRGYYDLGRVSVDLEAAAMPAPAEAS